MLNIDWLRTAWTRTYMQATATQLELDDVDDIYSDVTFKGPFVGLEVHF